MELDNYLTSIIAEQATGCIDAGSYMDYATEHGYKYIEVVNWSSSAGDWQFIVSKDGKEWYLMEQYNNWPRAGFSHEIDEKQPLYGTADEVLEFLSQF